MEAETRNYGGGGSSGVFVSGSPTFIVMASDPSDGPECVSAKPTGKPACVSKHGLSKHDEAERPPRSAAAASRGGNPAHAHPPW